MCAASLVAQNDILDEVKDFSSWMTSEDWIDIVEFGTEDQFENELAKGIDALTTKVMGMSGMQFANSMSYEMGQWIKDTSLLWIKNKGAGSTTTEAQIRQE